MAPFEFRRFEHVGAHPVSGETIETADKIAQRQVAFADVRSDQGAQIVQADTNARWSARLCATSTKPGRSQRDASC